MVSKNILLEGLNQFHLNNFQNALPSDFELLRIKVLIFCILSKLTKISKIISLLKWWSTKKICKKAWFVSHS